MQTLYQSPLIIPFYIQLTIIIFIPSFCSAMEVTLKYFISIYLFQTLSLSIYLSISFTHSIPKTHALYIYNEYNSITLFCKYRNNL